MTHHPPPRRSLEAEEGDETLQPKICKETEGWQSTASSLTDRQAGTGNGGRQPYPWHVKGVALAMVLLFNWATYWFSSSLGPLKTTLKSELSVNNAQYGVIASAGNLVNTVVPFVSGILIDFYGAERCSWFSSVIILVGAVLSGVGATVLSYPLLVVGEVIVGFGSITIQTSQLKIYTHWFHGSHLGLVIGLNHAANRVVVVVAKATAIPIARHAGWEWVIWVPAFISALVLFVNSVYVVWERRLPRHQRAFTGQQRAQEDGSTPFGSQIYRIWSAVVNLPASFWLFVLTQLLQNSLGQTYVSLQADMVTQTRGVGLLKAGWISAVGQIPVIVLSPLCGAIFDRFGYRMHFVPFASLLFILLFCLMGFTKVSAIGLTMLQGVALGINLMPIIASIPIFVPSIEHIATAQGTYESFVNSGAVILSTSAGAIQDRTPKGPGTYTNVFIFFIVIKILDFFIGIGYLFLDKYYLNGILARSEEKQRIRDDQIAKGELQEVRGRLREPNTAWTAAGLIVCLVMTVVAWVVYLVFAQGS